MNICLIPMTKALCRAYFQKFVHDPILFLDTSKFQPYVYSEEKCDALVERYAQLGRVYMAAMLDSEPIGEVILKNIDHEKRCCTLGIHMKNDAFKNKGYGTQAEILILKYAFYEMNMESVYADAILKNTRSQHVLEKVGFRETHQDDTFRFYRCDKDSWKLPQLAESL